MSWFQKKIPYPILTPKVLQEIEDTKDAQTKAFQDAHQTSKDLNKLLVENGFTLKIYLATGGKTKGHAK